MYGVSSNFLTAIQQSGRMLRSQATVTKTGYTTLNLDDSSIMSISQTATTLSGEDFEIGTVCSAELDMEINNISGNFSTAAFQGATVTASIAVQRADLTYEYCPLGVFYVDTVAKTETSIMIKCYDAIVLMEALYQSTLTYPKTLLQIAQDIATKAGLTLTNTNFPNASFSVAKAPNLAGVTLRSALSWVAEAAGCFARIDRSGKLDINFYASSGQIISAANYFTLLHDDLSRAAITQVVIQQSVGGASVSAGIVGNTYTITGNPLLVNNPSGALTAIYTQLHNFTYMPFNADWQGNPAFMAGDAITITDRNNNSYSTIMTECDISYEGGLKGTATALSLTSQAQSFTTATAVTDAVDAVVAGQQTITNLLAGNITATNIAVGSLTASVLQAGTITAASGVIANAAIGTAQIATGAIGNAQIATAAIGTANIQTGAITTALIGTATITTANIQNGAITNALIGTAAIGTANIQTASITDALISSVGASKLTAGTIDASQITVTNLNCANLTVGTINGVQITAGAIGATQLAAAINTAITTAQTTATTAQTTASGKNSAYYGSTPTGTFKNGDLWFNTTNGNQLSIWNGTAWTLSKFGNLAVANLDCGAITTGYISTLLIAAGTISAAQIATGTITATQIMTGTITATQIAAGTITATQIAAGTITATQINTTGLTVGTITTSGSPVVGTIGNFTDPGGFASAGFVLNYSGTQMFSIFPNSNSNTCWMQSPNALSITSGNGISIFSNNNQPCQIVCTTWVGGTTSNWVSLTPLTIVMSIETGKNTFNTLTLSYTELTSTCDIVAPSFNGKPFSVSGVRWTVIPAIDGTGVMEIGKFLDFHETAADTADYTSRLYSNGGVLTTMGGFTCAGQFTTNGSTYPQIIGNGTILQLANSSASTAGVIIEGGDLRPATDNQLNLGSSTKRWATVYAITGTINTSDRNQKNNIKELDETKAVDFVMALNPVTYKFNTGKSGRTHYGMIAQDVENEMTALCMTSLDFAGFVKTPMDEGGYIYGLRYEEFIAPLIKTVQYLANRVKELERRTAR
jgi:hypothetical protein